MNKWWALVIVFIIILLGVAILVLIPGPKTAQAPTAASLDDLIKVTSPTPHAHVTSPLVITGQARGNWFFEATAPVELEDATGKVIAQGHINATSDWMTTDYVPFTATLTFPVQGQLQPGNGTLILKNDNPSGDPSKQKELDIPVTF